MAYVLTDGANNVVTYPYSIGLLRRDNPNVSFPASPTDQQLADWNVFPVVASPMPSYDVINDNIAEATPSLVLDMVTNTYFWGQQWSVTPATPQEIADRTAAYEAQSNNEAARLLAESDVYWTQAFEDGVGLHQDFLTYRNDLKNPSSLFGYPANTVYPTFPTNIFDNTQQFPIDVYDKAYIDGLASTVTTAIGLKADTTNVNTALALKADKTDVATDLSAKLDLAGGTMTGEIDMGFNAIVGLADPVMDQDAAHKKYVDDAVAAAGGGGSYLPLTGGTLTGNFRMIGSFGDPWLNANNTTQELSLVDWGNTDNRIQFSGGMISLLDGSGTTALTPTQPEHVATKAYVDAIPSPAGFSSKAIYLETEANNITTSPVIAGALTSIGTTNGYTIYLGFGEYRETGPIVIDNKWQLQIEGPPSAMTTAATIKNGLTIQNSNGVRMTRVQIEQASSISCRAGLGFYFDKCQFTGNLTISGTGGFMMFTDCDFGANVTVDPAFAGTVYIIRSNFSGSSGVYTFGQASPVQVIIGDPTGLVANTAYNAFISGISTYKSGAQAYFMNGIGISTAGATNNTVLKFTSTSNAFVPQADNTTDGTKLPLAGGTMTGMITLADILPTAARHATSKQYVDAAIAKNGSTALRPTGANAWTGMMYFDTTLQKPIWWTGTAWKDATGTTV